MKPENHTDTIVVKTTAANKSGKGKFHMPNGDGVPICSKSGKLQSGRWAEKPLSVYPPVWREEDDWCGDCLRILKRDGPHKA